MGRCISSTAHLDGGDDDTAALNEDPSQAANGDEKREEEEEVGNPPRVSAGLAHILRVVDSAPSSSSEPVKRPAGPLIQELP